MLLAACAAKPGDAKAFKEVDCMTENLNVLKSLLHMWPDVRLFSVVFE